MLCKSGCHDQNLQLIVSSLDIEGAQGVFFTGVDLSMNGEKNGKDW